jgi:hypothetical protein
MRAEREEKDRIEKEKRDLTIAEYLRKQEEAKTLFLSSGMTVKQIKESISHLSDSDILHVLLEVEEADGYESSHKETRVVRSICGNNIILSDDYV